MGLGRPKTNSIDFDRKQRLNGFLHLKGDQIEAALLLVILVDQCKSRVSGVLKLFAYFDDIAPFEHQEVSLLGAIPDVVPKVGPAVHTALVSDIHGFHVEPASSHLRDRRGCEGIASAHDRLFAFRTLRPFGLLARASRGLEHLLDLFGPGFDLTQKLR